MKVRVYWNFHKKCYSVQSQVNGRWKVTHHVADSMFLLNVTFHVSKAGRERVRREKRKNVHAKIHGTWMAVKPVVLQDTIYKVSYNPYVNETFVKRTDVDEIGPIESCRGLRLIVNGIDRPSMRILE